MSDSEKVITDHQPNDNGVVRISDMPPDPDAHLSDEEKARIVSICYTMGDPSTPFVLLAPSPVSHRRRLLG